ncbi:MAG: metallophosphoesterase [Polyangiaceae bacterium]|nr:metallophosphoesterase [Polyangiaceae bacterium]
MVRINWLHLSDLHQGLDSAETRLWPSIHDALYEDLKQLHRKCGPWDLVLFTGDLTQRGGADEFKELTETLTGLWRFFKTLGSPNPKLVVVPGNHDLVRPTAKDLSAVPALADWDKREPGTVHDALNAFWAREKHDRRIVASAFANYLAWREQWPFERVSELPGQLPGDFTATFEKGGIAVGLVGLNSAFLQLTKSEAYKGRLDLLGNRQLPVVEQDRFWYDQHDLCMLLTHHPPDWFCEGGGFSEIARPGRFALHLYGHNHEARMRSFVDSGGPEQREFLGASLLGLEKIGDRTERLHGYCAGQLKVESGRARVRFWPRRARRYRDQRWMLEPDIDSFPFLDADATRPWEFSINRGITMLVEEDEHSPSQLWGGGGHPVHWCYLKVKNHRRVGARNVRVRAVARRGLDVHTYHSLLWGRYDPRAPAERPPSLVDLPSITDLAGDDDGYAYCRLGVLKEEDRVFCLDTAQFWGLPWQHKEFERGFIGFVDRDHPRMSLELKAEADCGACSSVLHLDVRYDGGWADRRQDAFANHVRVEDVSRRDDW